MAPLLVTILNNQNECWLKNVFFSLKCYEIEFSPPFIYIASVVHLKARIAIRNLYCQELEINWV